MEAAIDFLDYELKATEHRLGEEQKSLRRALERIQNHTKNIDFYEGQIKDYNLAINKLKESI